LTGVFESWAHPERLVEARRQGFDAALIDMGPEPYPRFGVELAVERLDCAVGGLDHLVLAIVEQVAGSIGLCCYPAQMVADRPDDPVACAATASQSAQVRVVVVAQDLEIELARQTFFAAEVVVDAADTGLATLPQIVDRRGRDSVVQEAFERGAEDRLPAGRLFGSRDRFCP
jgi:hypothetical protein